MMDTWWGPNFVNFFWLVGGFNTGIIMSSLLENPKYFRSPTNHWDLLKGAFNK